MNAANENIQSDFDTLMFCKKLPKVELHAHLNGSFDMTTLQELYKIYLKNLDGKKPEKLNLDHYVCEDGRDWGRLSESFGLAHALTASPEAVTFATCATLRQFARDGCVYIELRSTPRPLPTRAAYIEAVLRGIKQGVASDIASGYIVSLDRSWPASLASEVVDLAVQYHGLEPALVVGVDLCGNPDLGRVEEFAPALMRAREAGLKLTMHCAEVSRDDETTATLGLRPQRVGHAVRTHPRTGGRADTWTRLRHSRACVEVCLTSNVATRTIASYDSHHVRHLLQDNIPFVICTDDAGVFNTSLSQEYFKLLTMCGLDMTKATVARLVRKSCDFAFAPEKVLSKVRERIDAFVETLGLDDEKL